MSTQDRIKAIQRRIGTTTDGIIGPATLSALEEWLGIAALNPAVSATLGTTPTQAQVRSGRSIYGEPGDEGNLVTLSPPYPLYYAGARVKSIRVHKAIAGQVEAALREVLAHYGAERIHALGLDIYDGCYNNRAVRGGSATSMHAWGIALDFDAAHNGNNVRAPQARFSAPEYATWFDIWERYGAFSMGRETGRDWMHLQFAKL